MYHDLPAELGSDATTVPRLLEGVRGQLPTAPDIELPVHIQAVIAADLGAPWIGKLQSAAPSGVRPVKWKHVERFVMEGFGCEPQLVREGLQAQTIVLTDVLETARSIDLSATIARVRVPVATMMLLRRWKGVAPDELTRNSLKVRHSLLRDVLERSGVGTLNDLVNTALSRDLDGMSAGRRRPMNLTELAIKELGGTINRITRLACQATAFAARHIDPENRIPSSEEFMASMRFSMGLPWFYAQDRLRELSRQQMAFDKDDPQVTQAVERIRRLAHVAGDYCGSELDEGGVRAVDDADYLRVQLADIVCGWARTIIYHRGLVELVHRFRLVLYNGEPLSLERAGRLDRQRREHRELLLETAGRGWSA